jgi:hypothetical protein
MFFKHTPKMGRNPRPKPPSVITKMILTDGRGDVIGAVDVELPADLYTRMTSR